ncbi:hypothetical protein RBI13_06375 [Alcaligenaceae bacterium A4P071]|nr:hypothetical protein [Alcaligenaceae bacterium A4P071]
MWLVNDVQDKRELTLRVDAYIKDVLARCDALKRAGMWLPEPTMRPRAWIENFESADQILAAQLLERFVFYNQRLTDSLLAASFASIADGLTKGPSAPDRDTLLRILPQALFTPVCGENPNPTDSGNFFCRRARQVLGVAENQIVTTSDAILAASRGETVVFVDDFIGSGDQFLSTWRDIRSGASFEEIQRTSGFTAIYLSLVGTQLGITKLRQDTPSVAICVSHQLDDRGSIWGLAQSNPVLFQEISQFLVKYVPRLTPRDPYMHQSDFLYVGYKRRGLFLAFEHSVPDATLPIFWCGGTTNWEPLIERN